MKTAPPAGAQQSAPGAPGAPKIALSASGIVIDTPTTVTRDLPALKATGAPFAATIATSQQRTQAYDFLKRTLRPRIAVLRSLFVDIKRSITDAHKTALTKERETLAPYIELDDRIESAVVAFDRAERARVEEERRRADEERRRIAAQAEVKSDESADLLAAADALEAEARTLTGSDRREALAAASQLRTEAAPVESVPPLSTFVPIVRPAVSKGRTVTYHAEIRDIHLLVAAVARGEVEVAALEPLKLIDNHPWLNALARDKQGSLSIPGVVAVPDESIR